MKHVERKPERRHLSRRRARATAGILGIGPVVLLLGAAGYEHVRSFKAAELLTPDELKGPHHQVASAVPTEGYLHVFQVATDWGEVEAEGLSLLRVRLDEVRALAELDEVSKSEVFLKSAGGAGAQRGQGSRHGRHRPGGDRQGTGEGNEALRHRPRPQGQAHLR
jgi:hypothetical protein